MTSVTGVDLSLTSTGVCRIDGFGNPALVSTWRLKSAGGKHDSVAERADRIVDLAERVLRCVGADDLVVIEGPSLGQSRQGGEHLRAGLWWWLVGTLNLQGRQVVEVSPAQVKKYATGKGSAGKDEVLAAVVRRYLDVPVAGNDVADALVLAAIGRRLLGEPIEASLPQANLTACRTAPARSSPAAATRPTTTGMSLRTSPSTAGC